MAEFLKPSIGSGRRREPAAPLPEDVRLTREELDAEIRSSWAFLHKIARGWQRANPLVNYDDLFGAACLGFVRAGRTYDRRNPRGAKFVTYAKWWADNQIRHLLDHEDRRLGPRSIRERREGMPRVQYESGMPTGRSFFEDDSQPFLETFADEPPSDDDGPPEDLWDRVRSVLHEREWTVVSLHYRSKMGYADIGRQLGVCRERVRQLHDRALEQLQRRLTV